MNRAGQMAAALRKVFSKAALRRAVTSGQENVPPRRAQPARHLVDLRRHSGVPADLGILDNPVGATFIALDIPPLRRRLIAWLERDEDHAGKD